MKREKKSQRTAEDLRQATEESIRSLAISLLRVV